MNGKNFQDYLDIIKKEKDQKEDIKEVIKEEEKVTKKVSAKIKKEKPKKKSFSCPIETQDIAANLQNRQKAINEFGYGPLNPKENNDNFWEDKVKKWRLDSVEDSVKEAKKSVCGNCAAFVVTSDMLNCISKGLSSGDQNEGDSWNVIEASELGFCEALDFKCSASRTCDAWIFGGPITDDK